MWSSKRHAVYTDAYGVVNALPYIRRHRAGWSDVRHLVPWIHCIPQVQARTGQEKLGLYEAQQSRPRVNHSHTDKTHTQDADIGGLAANNPVQQRRRCDFMSEEYRRSVITSRGFRAFKTALALTPTIVV